MPLCCHWPIGPNQTCPNQVHRSHKVPKMGESWENATGERAGACKAHHYRKPRQTPLRLQKFRDEDAHLALYTEALKTDPVVWAAWNGQQVLPPGQPPRMLRSCRPRPSAVAAFAQASGDLGGVLLLQPGQGATGMDLGEFLAS